jgi:hypothetical protein
MDRKCERNGKFWTTDKKSGNFIMREKRHRGERMFFESELELEQAKRGGAESRISPLLPHLPRDPEGSEKPDLPGLPKGTFSHPGASL